MTDRRLVVVTATTELGRAEACIESWGDVPLIVVANGRPWTSQAGIERTGILAKWLVSPFYLGSVGAFSAGVEAALEEPEVEVVACLHDDLEIQDPYWAAKVLQHFDTHPGCGLAGFGGATGLGHAEIYDRPYDPRLLARQGFVSNMADAEQHGKRSAWPQRVACLDGFSQIGARAFLEKVRPWQELETLGIVHHFYDGALGCLAARHGWETWYLPIACRHYGGRTAVGDAGYQAWAKQQVEGGDQGFWEAAHRIGYEAFRDVLPLRVRP